LEFDQGFETARIIGDLLFLNGTSTVWSSAAIPSGKDGVWLFAGNLRLPANPILLFNTTTKVVQVPAVNADSLPTFYEVPASTSGGRYGYLIGGLGRVNESDGSPHPTNCIIS
jgi:hypothetical protein